MKVQRSEKFIKVNYIWAHSDNGQHICFARIRSGFDSLWVHNNWECGNVGELYNTVNVAPLAEQVRILPLPRPLKIIEKSSIHRTMNGYDIFHTYSTSVNCVAAITKEVANLQMPKLVLCDLTNCIAFWEISSAGSVVLPLQGRGHRFESYISHFPKL